MKRCKVVLFLGAGFSRAFGLPVMTEFTDFVRGHDRVDQAHATVLDQVIKDARQANSFLLSDPKNIEDILSFAEMTDRLELNKDLSRADHIRRILGAVYASAPSERDRVSAARSFSALLDYEADEQQRAVRGFSPDGLSIVTTNYDLSAEHMLQSIGCTVTLGSAAAKSPFMWLWLAITAHALNNAAVMPIDTLVEARSSFGGAIASSQLVAVPWLGWSLSRTAPAIGASHRRSGASNVAVPVRRGHVSVTPWKALLRPAAPGARRATGGAHRANVASSGDGVFRTQPLCGRCG